MYTISLQFDYTRQLQIVNGMHKTYFVRNANMNEMKKGKGKYF